jgi:hydroxyacid-oxoacid transhydrogenase
MPNGLSGVGYSDADIEALTDRTLPQKRLLDIAPRDISRDDLRQLFKDSMRYW